MPDSRVGELARPPQQDVFVTVFAPQHEGRARIRDARWVHLLLDHRCMNTLLRIAPLTVAAVFAAACGAAKSDQPQHPSATHETHQANVGEVSEGAALYTTNCAGCHGAAGKGTAVVPAVVGENALPLSPGPKLQVRKTEFRTAKDVFDFIRTTMPANKPGSLSDDTYYAILAFNLKLNGVDLHGMKVDPTTVAQIRLPDR